MLSGRTQRKPTCSITRTRLEAADIVVASARVEYMLGVRIPSSMFSMVPRGWGSRVREKRREPLTPRGIFYCPVLIVRRLRKLLCLGRRPSVRVARAGGTRVYTCCWHRLNGKGLNFPRRPSLQARDGSGFTAETHGELVAAEEDQYGVALGGTNESSRLR